MSNILDSHASDVIVGAGIVGLSIAYQLTLRGASPVVVDRSGPGAGMTAIQPGGVRQQWGSRVNCLLGRESMHFYRELDERLGSSTGATLLPGGYLFVAHTAETTSRLEQNRLLQNELGIPSVRLTPEEAAELVPGLDVSSVLAAFFCQEDGYFDHPQAVVAALAAAAVSRGARIVSAEVSGISRRLGGWSLRLAGETDVSADRVVVAASYESPALVQPLGIHLPIRKEARHLFYSNPIQERLLEPLVVSPERHFAAKQLADGSVLASDLSAEGPPDEAEQIWRERIRSNIVELLPILRYVSFPVHVPGFYDLTPDSQMLLGPVNGDETLWVAAGMSGRGFMMAPAVGRIVADALTGGTPDELLHALSLDRFEHDGLVPEPQVV